MGPVSIYSLYHPVIGTVRSIGYYEIRSGVLPCERPRCAQDISTIRIPHKNFITYK